MAEECPIQLLQKLLDQNPTAAETAKRLETIIDQEIAMPDGQRNQELVDACVDLQWYLATGEHYVSDRENARARLEEQIRSKARKAREGRARRLIPRLAAAACCAALLLALPIAGRGILRIERIRGTSVEGGEVYQLNGETVEAWIVDAAIAEAEADEEDFSITTTDYEMISKIRGVDEMHLRYVPEGWKLEDYRYTRIENVIYYREAYNYGAGGKSLVYKCAIYPDSKSVNDELERSQAGEPVLMGDYKVYFTQNVDLTVAVWSDGLTSYSVYAPLDQQELIEVIQSVGGVLS